MNQNSPGFLNSIPPVVRNIIFINILVWVAQIVLLQKGIDLADYLGLHYISSPQFQPHQIITSMFLHATFDYKGNLIFTHILFNMFAVFMFGRMLESIWGGKKFLIYYLATGIGAALLQLLVTYLRINSLEAGLSSAEINEVYTKGLQVLQQGKNYIDSDLGNLNSLLHTGMVGASGAVFGILVAFGMMFPNAELMIIPIPIPIKAKWLVIGYGALELGLGIMDRAGDNVAHFAHLGGLITGFIILMFWRNSNKRYNDKLF